MIYSIKLMLLLLLLLLLLLRPMHGVLFIIILFCLFCCLFLPNSVPALVLIFSECLSSLTDLQRGHRLPAMANLLS